MTGLQHGSAAERDGKLGGTSPVPVSVAVLTLNEQARLPACLAALEGFEDVHVLDSNSRDNTQAIADSCNARVTSFTWDGRYPKKKQWALENLDFRHEWVLLLDADEVVRPEMMRELADLMRKGVDAYAGFFLPGLYVMRGRVLSRGMCNNKLALLNPAKMAFPVVDDLDIPGGSEVEWHYQPVLKRGESGKIGHLRSGVLHYAMEDMQAWAFRHEKYARWEAQMGLEKRWPPEITARRSWLKHIFRKLPRRDLVAFAHSYILRAGFCDGRAGLEFARLRARYYRRIAQLETQLKAQLKARQPEEWRG